MNSENSMQAILKTFWETSNDKKELIIKEWVESNIGYMQEQKCEVYSIDDVIAQIQKVHKLEAENERLKRIISEMMSGTVEDK